MSDTLPTTNPAASDVATAVPLARWSGLVRTVGEGDSATRLLGPVDVTVAPGTRLVILGPSGAGKTLLLRALADLDPGVSAETSGSLLDDGVANDTSGTPRRYCHARAAERRHRILLCPQDPPRHPGTVADNLAAVRSLAATAPHAAPMETVARWLEELDLPPDIQTAEAARCSGGEMARIALVRALQLDPSLLLLDEPTSALDAARVQAMESLLDAWIAERPQSRAIVFTVHDERQARRLGREFLVLAPGGTVAHAQSNDADAALAALAEVTQPLDSGESVSSRS